MCRSGAPKRLLYVLGANCPPAVQMVLAGSNHDPAIAPLCPHRCRNDFGDLLIVQDPLAAACKVIRGIGNGVTEVAPSLTVTSRQLQMKAIRVFSNELSSQEYPGRSEIFLKAYCLSLLFWGATEQFDFNIRRKSKSPLWDVAVVLTAASLSRPDLCRYDSLDDEVLKGLLSKSEVGALSKYLADRVDFRCGDPSIEFRTHLTHLCESLKPFDKTIALSNEILPVPFYLALGTVHRSGRESMTPSRAEGILKRILYCSADDSERLVREKMLANLIRDTVVSHNSRIPLISTVNLEQTLIKLGSVAPRFLLQLVYCFVFAEMNPSSPFKFDPRAFPLPHIVSASSDFPIGRELRELIYHNCGEVKLFMNFFDPKSDLDLAASCDAKRKLSSVILDSMTHPERDPDGENVELAFRNFAPSLTFPDMIATSAGCLLASCPLSPFTTYSMLYRDPLCLLKCSLNHVWSRGGTRRLLIYLLDTVLKTNAVVAQKEARDTSSFDDYLACRNAIVLQCLLTFLTCEKLPVSCRHCCVAISFVREMIAQNPGLATSLLTFELSEAQRDWIIEWIPEMMGDVSALRVLLMEGSSLATAQRLCIADFSLRLLIANSTLSSSASEGLLSAALSQLISSFFVVLGPVGLSVEVVLCGDVKRTDSTKIARRAALRMIRAMEKIRGFRTGLRSECLSILQKLSAYCRNDSVGQGGSLPPGITGKQKLVLRELGDAVSKSLESLGQCSG